MAASRAVPGSSNYSGAYGAPPTRAYVTYNPYNGRPQPTYAPSGASSSSTAAPYAAYASYASSKPAAGAASSVPSYMKPTVSHPGSAYTSVAGSAGKVQVVGSGSAPYYTSSTNHYQSSSSSYGSYAAAAAGKPTAAPAPVAPAAAKPNTTYLVGGPTYSSPAKPAAASSSAAYSAAYASSYAPPAASVAYTSPAKPSTTAAASGAKLSTSSSTSSFSGAGAAIAGGSGSPSSVLSPSQAAAQVAAQLKLNAAQELAEAKQQGYDVRACSITRAVFIGINYTGQRGLELKGCVNDVSNSIATFRELGFDGREEDNMRVLTDRSKRKPTKTEMIASMNWLLSGAKSGDVLFWHYSGHGSREDTDTQDEGGEGETIIPVDYTTKGSIVDEQMYMLMVKPIPAGVSLYAVFDCCHSGRVLNLRYVYDEYNNALWADPQYRERKAEEGTVYMLSGCMTTQTSADLPPDAKQGLKAQSVGALTSAYLPLIKAGYSWGKFIKELRTGLKKSALTQVPQLESSREFDLDGVAFAEVFPKLGVIGQGAHEKYVPQSRSIEVPKRCKRVQHKHQQRALAAGVTGPREGRPDGREPVRGDGPRVESYRGL